ncbi:hypothetical protein [Croceicoccus mobilis]|uniref:Uncharacterized protein n=1 Tax=Croceicoccus mobilis TaxID=1703339 RepID=A0A916Z9K8_9SPHN|nr:hypothetical protein [Croceicoccus mobilis]GGD83198.1 hypothetical protein GCM10010990_36590 [Croceicoccus mobilis]
MAIWPPYGDHIIYEPDQMDLLQKALKEAPEIVTLINLGEVHAHVLAALPENAGSTADLVRRHSTVSPKVND